MCFLALGLVEEFPIQFPIADYSIETGKVFFFRQHVDVTG